MGEQDTEKSSSEIYLKKIIKQRPNDPQEEQRICDVFFERYKSSIENCIDLTGFKCLIEDLITPDDISGDVNHNDQENVTFDETKIREIFAILSQNETKISEKLFTESVWPRWLSKIIWPRTALIVVDVQNDFISGSLGMYQYPAKQLGEDTVRSVNEILETFKFDRVVYTQDWHPTDHISFHSNVCKRSICEIEGEKCLPNVKENEIPLYATVKFDDGTQQKLWPVHCLQNTFGAELHKDLKILNDSIIIKKGVNSNIDSYSAFIENDRQSRTPLFKILNDAGISDVYLCGIAHEVCVKYTALDSRKLGFRTIVIKDATSGIDLKTINEADQEMKADNCLIVVKERLPNLLNGIDRPFILAYDLALNIAA